MLHYVLEARCSGHGRTLSVYAADRKAAFKMARRSLAKQARNGRRVIVEQLSCFGTPSSFYSRPSIRTLSTW
jgi:hypothetical protein